MINEVLGHTVIRVLDVLKSISPNSPLIYIETGTCRDRHPYPGDPKDARSTLAVARWVVYNSSGGEEDRCFSIDLHHKHVEIAKSVLAEEKLEKVFEFLQNYGSIGLLSLKKFKPNLVLLDADSNHNTTFEEYKAISDSMSEPGFIIIDDINRNGINKGKLIIEERNNLSLPWKMIAKHVAVIPFGTLAIKALELL